MRRVLPHRAYAWVFVVLLAGCATPDGPDLARLYQETRSVDQPPVILVHGILGARLADDRTGEEAWYGNVWKLATSNYEILRLDIDSVTLEPHQSGLVPSGLAEKAAGRDYYGAIIRTLEDVGGYRRAEAGVPPPAGAPSLYVFTYDWRQDNVVTAGLLSNLIEQIRADHRDPDLEVDIIAHSMGGLVTRYYLRYGAFDTLDDNDFPVNLHGAERVRRVILLGTPNVGSISSLHAFISGYGVGFGTIPTEVLATFPSTYQVFPHALHDWLYTAEGKPLERDVFDVEIWRRFQWSIYDPEVERRMRAEFGDDAAAADAYMELMDTYFEKRLERARRFVWSLTVPVPDGAQELIVFGGDCLLTPARMVVEEVDGVSRICLDPDEIIDPAPDVDFERLMLEPGDGTVTKASLLARGSLDPRVPRHRYVNFPLAYPMFVCEKHDQLTGNITFQNNLMHALLSQDSELESP